MSQNLSIVVGRKSRRGSHESRAPVGSHVLGPYMPNPPVLQRNHLVEPAMHFVIAAAQLLVAVWLSSEYST